MVKVINEKDEMKNLRVDENGNLKVRVVSEEGGQTEEKEVTLLSELLTIGTTATTKAINKKVTSVMIANYSETASVTIDTFVIGPNLALELPINEQITSLSITATEDNTKIQLVVKGVE